MIIYDLLTNFHPLFFVDNNSVAKLKAKQKSLASDTETHRGFPGYSLTAEGECEMKGESFFVAIGVVGYLAQEQMWCSFYG